LSSSYQLVGNLLPPLRRGITVNVMGRWTQQTGWDALEKTQASILVGNPTLLTELLIESRARGRIPAKLRLTVSGGAPVPPTLKRALRNEWKLPLAESYGQSELGGFMALGDPDLVSEEKFGAAGRPLPDKEVRILDANGNECPVGDVGEVCLRGGFMKGYWGKPEKTAEALRGGWLHSGDAGTMDRDGYVTMRGRFAELITVEGRTWFPRDVEEALCMQAGVKEAAVVALPDAKLGQRPVAYVTLDGDAVDVSGLKTAIAPLVGYDLTPLTIKSVVSFPMTPTGKIAKAELRQSALAEQ
jgi:acyl-coenzyme A synthetase/AMP-(fatty) acid ligase